MRPIRKTVMACDSTVALINIGFDRIPSHSLSEIQPLFKIIMVSRGVFVLSLVAIYIGQSSAETCLEKSGIPMDEANAFAQTGNAGQNLKCVFKCIMKKLNVINDDGTMDTDTMIALNPPEKADLARKCSNFPPGDPCENAYLHYKCARENDPDYFNKAYYQLLNNI